MAPSAVTQIPLVPELAVAAAVSAAPGPTPPPPAAAPQANAAPQVNATSAAATPQPAPASKLTARLPLLIGVAALAIMVTLGVGGLFVYNTMFSAPQLTQAQFDRLSSVHTYGGQKADFSASFALGWSWFGEEEGNLPACQKSAAFDTEHLLSTYHANTNPNGGLDGSVMLRLFGNKSELATYQRLWADCDAAAKAANTEGARGRVGSTSGVAWERYDEVAIFWYGNVQVLGVKNYDSDASVAAEANAVKALIDSLR